MSDAQLRDQLKQARRQWLANRDLLGRLAAYAHDSRDFSWQEIADLTAVDVTTARRWTVQQRD